jgi:hypothetical protein
MNEYKEEFVRLVARQEATHAFRVLEKACMRRKLVPSPLTLLGEKHRARVIDAAAILVGSISGLIIVIINFIIFVRLLHLEP